MIQLCHCNLTDLFTISKKQLPSLYLALHAFLSACREKNLRTSVASWRRNHLVLCRESCGIWSQNPFCRGRVGWVGWISPCFQSWWSLTKVRCCVKGNKNKVITRKNNNTNSWIICVAWQGLEWHLRTESLYIWLRLLNLTWQILPFCWR